MTPYIFACIAVLAIASGQILFKTVALKLVGRPLSEALTDTSVLIPFFLAATIYAGATVFWILALRDLSLSRGYMFMAASFVIVPVISSLLFDERLSLGFLAGVALIITGMIVTQTT